MPNETIHCKRPGCLRYHHLDTFYFNNGASLNMERCAYNTLYKNFDSPPETLQVMLD